MSALTDDIGRHHWRLGVGHPDIAAALGIDHDDPR